MKRALLTCCFLIYAAIAFTQVQDTLSKASVDLSAFSLSNKQIIPLDGNWEFYPNELLTSEDLRSGNSHSAPLIVKPSSWSDMLVNGKKFGGKGFGTYRLVLENAPGFPLMLNAFSIQTSYRVFVNDSLMLEVGKPGTSKETTVPMNRDAMISLPAAKHIEIFVQVANFHHRKGGFVRPFEIGAASAIMNEHMLYYMLDVIESSALFILGLFLFALYIFRRKDLSILYFSLFCITLSFRPVIAVNYLLSYIFENVNWNLMLKLEYFGVLFPCLFMLMFIKKLFPEQLPAIFVRILSVILVLMIVTTLFFPPSVFSWLIPPLLIIIPTGVIIFGITIIRAMLANVEGARYAGFGLIILLLSLILKVMVYANVIPAIHVLITGLDIAFIFTMSMILGSRFSLQFAKVERLQQTTEIQRKDIEEKKAAIEEQNKSIIDSINYAKRIQDALLPTEKIILRELNKTKAKDS